MATGIKLGEYKTFLYFVRERVEELKDLTVELNYGEEFSMTNILGEFFIDVVEQLDGQTDRYTKKFFSDKINTNIYWFAPYYNEYFILLHEIGHIITRKFSSNAGYEEFKKKQYNNKYEVFATYRDIPSEKLADMFAIEFTNKYFYDICKFFHPGETIESINDFLGIV